MTTPALRYHEATKHYFQRFARSAGHLDWKTQPNPFRRYAGAPLLELPRVALDRGLPYAGLYEPPHAPAPPTVESVGELLRCSLGPVGVEVHPRLAVGAAGQPVERQPASHRGYVVWDAGVFHYAPDVHALEHRGTIDRQAWDDWSRGAVLVGLTSIHWREAWKYGERAYRYCQHDVGHAIAALRFAAALLGWRMALLPRWSDADVGGAARDRSRRRRRWRRARDAGVPGGGDARATRPASRARRRRRCCRRWSQAAGGGLPTS